MAGRRTAEPCARGGERAAAGAAGELTEEVSRNESLLRKTQERELELLRAGSLAQLLQRLIQGLRSPTNSMR